MMNLDPLIRYIPLKQLTTAEKKANTYIFSFEKHDV